jgi:Pentapeptide repeats (8 copies)
MSDEQGEQTPADAWGQPINAERQAELRGYLDRWETETDHGRRRGPFYPSGFEPGSVEEKVRLTGADVSWLAEQSERDESGHLSNLNLEQARLFKAHLEGANLKFVHLEHANLAYAHLEKANLGSVHLEGARLSSAHLEGADLGDARLEGANLGEAHLEGADLSYAHLEGARLTGVWLDSKTVLTHAYLDDKTRLGDIHWSGVGAVDLTTPSWANVRTLGDEHGVGLRADDFDHEAVVRAYRQVAAQLRAQGMNEVADRFLFRAQVRQRGVLLRRLHIPQYLGSWILAILAGYGYRPGRTLFWYFAVIAGFTVLYMQATTGWVPFGLPAPSALAPLPWYEALILSVSSFHGRGFFQPLQSLGDPIAALAAIEAVVGLFIEIAFIATFTQRFFGSK